MRTLFKSLNYRRFYNEKGKVRVVIKKTIRYWIKRSKGMPILCHYTWEKQRRIQRVTVTIVEHDAKITNE